MSKVIYFRIIGNACVNSIKTICKSIPLLDFLERFEI